MTEEGEITGILHQARNGNDQALNLLIPLVYDELRQLAAHYLRGERSGHSLQTTALVHEAYLRLCGAQTADWRDRKHFFAAAAQVMRHILVDYARARSRLKRGGGVLPLNGPAAVLARDPDELLAIDLALQCLARVSARQSRIVELRYFCGLSIEEVAGVLDVSERTVKSDWQMAKAWLYSQVCVRR